MFRAGRGGRRLAAAAAAGFVVGSALCAPARADTLDDYVHAEMESRRLPSLSFVAIKAGEIVDQRSYGLANLETKSPASAETVFAIGSITKSMTAIAVMKLAESGAIALDDAIGSHVEGLPKRWRPLTIRQLMSNTSGVPGDLDNPCGHEGPPVSPGSRPYSREDFFAEVSCLPLLDPPGAAFHYSDFNFQMLGLLIERRTGKAYADALNEIIFAPLGMNASGALDYKSLIDMRADGYEWREDGYVNSAPMDADLEFSSGGVLSTAGDMAKFLAALGGPLLTPGSWETLWTKPASVKRPTPYAMGFGVTPYKGVRRAGHNGAAVGFASSFSYFPEQGAGVVVLTNSYQEPLGRNVQDLANEIALRSGVIAVD
mgnify:CR=1 FL=1